MTPPCIPSCVHVLRSLLYYFDRVATAAHAVQPDVTRCSSCELVKATCMSGSMHVITCMYLPSHSPAVLRSGGVSPSHRPLGRVAQHVLPWLKRLMRAAVRCMKQAWQKILQVAKLLHAVPHPAAAQLVEIQHRLPHGAAAARWLPSTHASTCGICAPV